MAKITPAEVRTTRELVDALKIAKGDPATKKWGGAVFLIGAGCSISTGIQSAPDIARTMICRLADCLCGSASTASDDAEAALTRLQDRGSIEPGVRWEDLYSQVFEHFFQDPKVQQEIILRAIEKKVADKSTGHTCASVSWWPSTMCTPY